MTLTRRDLLKYSAVTTAGVAGLSVATVTGPAEARKKKKSAAKFPGHKPGRIFLGVTAAGSINDSIRNTGPVGLARTYYRWGDGSREDRNIKADHAANRMPWVSFKPASTAKGGWAAIASGRYDADIRARARRYARHSKPIIVTFNHEPHNDKTGSPADFARAWVRIHDVMKAETGLKNVISVPILGEWEFSPINRHGDPGAFLPNSILSRCHFVGTDLYQNKTGQGYSVRLAGILKWLDGRGHSDLMVGIGETGATNDFGKPNGATWWTDSWNWAASHSNRVCAIAYFNSSRNNTLKKTWPLNESSAKLAAFKRSLASSTACKL